MDIKELAKEAGLYVSEDGETLVNQWVSPSILKFAELYHQSKCNEEPQTLGASLSANEQDVDDTVEVVKLKRIARASSLIINDYWKYLSEESAKKELKDSYLDYIGYLGTLSSTPKENSMDNCKCDMRTKLLGDGCQQCNPQVTIDSLNDEIELLRQQLAVKDLEVM